MGPSGIAGSYLTHGLSSEFVHVLIIVDTKKVAGYPLQTVSDYANDRLRHRIFEGAV